MNTLKKIDLFLTGGGARGAYQAGVLMGISEILGTEKTPFNLISGVSTGSINAAYLAGHAENFNLATKQLVDIWSEIHVNKVFKTSNLSLFWSILKTIRNLILHHNPSEGHYLLNSEPLRELIESNIDFKKLHNNIQSGIIEGLEIAALNYDTANTTAFISSNIMANERSRFRYTSVNTEITSDHVMASASLPLFFPSIKIGLNHYGDGAFRNKHPLRTGISLGADKILIIEVKTLNRMIPTNDSKIDGISFGRILSMAFNSIFLDNIELDLELMDYINMNISPLSQTEKGKMGFRHIEYLSLHPSVDLGELSIQREFTLPRLLRYLLNGFGSSRQSSDLMSYMLFESEYCKSLIETGYNDALNQKETLMAFFST